MGPGLYRQLCQGCSQDRLSDFLVYPDQVMPLAGLQKGGAGVLKQGHT